MPRIKFPLVLLFSVWAGAAAAAGPVSMIDVSARITSTTPQVVEAVLLDGAGSSALQGCTAVGAPDLDANLRTTINITLIDCAGKPALEVKAQAISPQDRMPGILEPVAVGVPLLIQLPKQSRL